MIPGFAKPSTLFRSFRNPPLYGTVYSRFSHVKMLSEPEMSSKASSSLATLRVSLDADYPPPPGSCFFPDSTSLGTATASSPLLGGSGSLELECLAPSSREIKEFSRDHGDKDIECGESND
jgi:hypothetical protein